MMMAKVCDLEPGDFVHTFGDLHLYSNHFDQAREQLSREPKPLPKMTIKTKPASIDQFDYDDFDLSGYQPHPKIKAPWQCERSGGKADRGRRCHRVGGDRA